MAVTLDRSLEMLTWQIQNHHTWGRYRIGARQPLVTGFLSRSLGNLVLCVSLFKDTLSDMYCEFRTIELMADGYFWTRLVAHP